MKILFVKEWRGNINRASMRLFPSLDKAVSHAVELCKANTNPHPSMGVVFETNWVQAYELFEDKKARCIRDFKKRVVDSINQGSKP
jgi:hypothetical protein